MIFNVFKKTPKSFLGIDIGTSSIRIVELVKKDKNIKLQNYGEVRSSLITKRPFKVFEEKALLISDKDTAKAIQAINLEAGIKTNEANFSIPDFSSFFTKVKLPVMSEEEIPQAIRYGIRSYIPLPLDEVTLDWIIIKGEIAKTSLEILVAAVPNNIIKQYKTIASASNLITRVLEPEVFSFVRSSIKENDKKKIVSLIDIGARTTTCNIVDNGILKKSYSFNASGNDLTELIAKSLDIGYNKSEAVKMIQGLSFEKQGKDSTEIRKILIPIIDLILEESKKTFRSFYREEGKEIDKIILAGGTALLPNLKEYFSTKFKKEISLADPFSDIEHIEMLDKPLKIMGPSYAIALGLALKGFE